MKSAFLIITVLFGSLACGANPMPFIEGDTAPDVGTAPVMQASDAARVTSPPGDAQSTGASAGNVAVVDASPDVLSVTVSDSSQPMEAASQDAGSLGDNFMKNCLFTAPDFCGTMLCVGGDNSTPSAPGASMWCSPVCKSDGDCAGLHCSATGKCFK